MYLGCSCYLVAKLYLTLLQPSSSKGIFPTQGSNTSLLYCRQILLPLSHQAPHIWVTYSDTFVKKVHYFMVIVYAVYQAGL